MSQDFLSPSKEGAKKFNFFLKLKPCHAFSQNNINHQYNYAE
jgi:hypothetical protein